MGFKQTVSDPCLHVPSEGDNMMIVAVYVDDILVAGRSDKQIMRVKNALARQFKMKDMGELHYFLGVPLSGFLQLLQQVVISSHQGPERREEEEEGGGGGKRGGRGGRVGG